MTLQMPSSKLRHENNTIIVIFIEFTTYIQVANNFIIIHNYVHRYLKALCQYISSHWLLYLTPDAVKMCNRVT